MAALTVAILGATTPAAMAETCGSPSGRRHVRGSILTAQVSGNARHG